MWSICFISFILDFWPFSKDLLENRLEIDTKRKVQELWFKLRQKQPIDLVGSYPSNLATRQGCSGRAVISRRPTDFAKVPTQQCARKEPRKTMPLNQQPTSLECPQQPGTARPQKLVHTRKNLSSPITATPQPQITLFCQLMVYFNWIRIKMRGICIIYRNKFKKISHPLSWHACQFSDPLECSVVQKIYILAFSSQI